MTSGEALRELNAAEDETRRQFSSYVSYAMMVGSQTEKEAIKSERIITAAVIGGSSVLGTIFLLIGGWMILFGILLIGIGIFSGIIELKGGFKIWFALLFELIFCSLLIILLSIPFGFLGKKSLKAIKTQVTLSKLFRAREDFNIKSTIKPDL